MAGDAVQRFHLALRKLRRRFTLQRSAIRGEETAQRLHLRSGQMEIGGLSTVAMIVPQTTFHEVLGNFERRHRHVVRLDGVTLYTARAGKEFGPTRGAG